MRTLGLDIGDKRIGVAISDPEEILASPLAIITREDDEKEFACLFEIRLDFLRKISIFIEEILVKGEGFKEKIS